jgi:predicted Zn-dependent protease
METLNLAINPPFQEFDPIKALQNIRAEGDWVGLRFYQEKQDQRQFRDGLVESSSFGIERGVMVEVMVDGQLAYAGTSDLSAAGVATAAKAARELAKSGAGRRIMDFTSELRPNNLGKYKSPTRVSLDQASFAELISKNIEATKIMKINDSIVSAIASWMITETKIHYVSTNGTDIHQEFLMIAPGYTAIAKTGSETQRRSNNGPGLSWGQTGLEIFNWDQIFENCKKTATEAIALTKADNCPSEEVDLILDGDQMLIQIHESIGHPLEIDRILGDERNYAGWSFVEPKDFGTLQYGSKLMNVTFDPTVQGEYASYAFDDCGNPAKREYLIEKGILKRGLGSLESQKRSGLPGVANFRSASWNRAPIDRMANINLEAGDKTLQEMISATERGIYMQTNVSWSIDDYRRKFQFGCQYGQLIENGQITKVVKNPNYRGVSVPFWNKLKAVGRKSEVAVNGFPYCGKGEPSQVIRVGHSSPPCLFEKVEVFGGGK